MNPYTFTKDEGRDYLEKEGVLSHLTGGVEGQLPPDYADLARLHALIRTRHAFSVLEFGVGWSSVVVAHALRENKREWDFLQEKPKVRVDTPFSLYAVDADPDWISVAKKLLADDVGVHVEIMHTPVTAGTFNDRMCHFYNRLPDVVPDFIYLDAPDPKAVEGAISGMTWQNPDRTVMAGDLLVMEPTLLPGTFVLVDGRTNNVRFLKHNLQRSWNIEHYPDADVSTLELVEPPLGRINRETLEYCLPKETFRTYQ